MSENETQETIEATSKEVEELAEKIPASSNGATNGKTTKEDWTSDQIVRWCPGCGDYSILTAMQLALPELNTRPEKTVFISGIGCAARFPYYMETYGIHGIHGRAPAIATGLAIARPDLDIWVIGGDGDMLSIGGNHLIHALRRNVKIKILLFNNQIYGLTKGQYSPTSEVGKITKSTPLGSLDEPFNPISIALGAQASFVARTHDMNRAHMQKTFKQAFEHEGGAFVEIYQNCNVFNDGIFDGVLKKDRREEMLIQLEDGKPITFGANGERGVAMTNQGKLEVVDAAGNEDRLLIHEAGRHNPTLAFALSQIARGPFEPTPVGIFRQVRREEYSDGIQKQLDYAQKSKGEGKLEELFNSRSTWEVK